MSLQTINRLPIHDFGALQGLTRWISTHDSGISEWLKNVRAAYQEKRADVKLQNRVAILLIKDKDKSGPARFGVLDVGGLSFDDVSSWSVWNDPDASSRGGPKQEENQGNGGKAYAYKMFKGPSYILGVKNNLCNQVGFIGEQNTLERGLPRYYPATNQVVWQSGNKIKPTSEEKDIEIKDWKEEVVKQLVQFKAGYHALPKTFVNAIERRNAFTIVVGVDPIDWKGGKSNIKQLIRNILHNQQSQRAIQEVDFYVMHNGKLINKDKPLELEKIDPYPGYEGPFEINIPEVLLGPDGNQVNTTKSSSGKHDIGKITLYTSKDSMESSWKLLKPRWVVNYRTKLENIGQKTITEIVPSTPGSHFIYADVDLDALSPDSVDAGRKRPNPTRLIKAVDDFLAEKIIDLAKKINELQKQEVSKSILDEIDKENEYLNNLKNEFLPAAGGLGLGDLDGSGAGKKKKDKKSFTYGKKPNKIEVLTYTLKIAQGIEINLKSILYPIIRDEDGNPVKSEMIWKSDDKNIIKLNKDGNCKTISAGICKIVISIKNTDITSPPIDIEVVRIKDVLLTPRDIKLEVGRKKQIISQINTINNQKHSDVILEWKHDSADKNLIKISPKGFIYGNRVGETNVTAGTYYEGGVWATNSVFVEVIPTQDKGKAGSGFPTLKICDKHYDDFTGKIREGDPDEPALWQEYWDVENNIWWLNTQSRDAHFAYEEFKKGNKQVWKMFHAKLLVEMVIQAYFQFDYTSKREGEKPTIWADHKYYYDRKYVELTQAMWEKYLEKYVRGEIDI
jgi:hypothetical protein